MHSLPELKNLEKLYGHGVNMFVEGGDTFLGSKTNPRAKVSILKTAAWLGKS